MPTSPVRSLIDHVRRAVQPEGDGELLGRFVDRRDEGALAELVNRHGPMVWAVCRRLLSHHDAEDAFQATFIVLVRKAGSIRPREMVGNWLFGVARQAALQARAAARRRERQVDQMPDAEAPQDRWADVRPILDEELSRLPGHFRAVIVLSDLEGMTRREVAVRLGCPEGTVASRLVRARAMLAKRLSGRGVALSGAALASALTQNAASAALPASVVTSTIKAASLCAAGHAAVSLQVAALTQGVLKAMLLTKLKPALAVVVVVAMVGLVGYGIALGQQNEIPAAPQKPAREKAEDAAVKDKAGKKDDTAWGKDIGGLQAGLGYKAGQNRAYRHGETVTLVVRVRNVGKETVGFQYLRSFFAEHPPAVTTAEGKSVIHATVKTLDQKELPVEVSLTPGKEVDLAELKYEFRGGIDMGTWQGPFSPLYATGKLGFQYPQVLGNSSLGKIKIDPDLLKLGTGKLELEVKDKPSGVKTAYPTAEIVVQYRDGSGRDSKQFRVEDVEAVATLASHLPGILGEKGSGPRASAGNRATLTIKFNHQSGEASQMRVAHVTADYATWWWRDNTPYTGDRQVEKKDELQGLMERLAANAKVDLK